MGLAQEELFEEVDDQGSVSESDRTGEDDGEVQESRRAEGTFSSSEKEGGECGAACGPGGGSWLRWLEDE